MNLIFDHLFQKPDLYSCMTQHIVYLINYGRTTTRFMVDINGRKYHTIIGSETRKMNLMLMDQTIMTHLETVWVHIPQIFVNRFFQFEESRRKSVKRFLRCLDYQPNSSLNDYGSWILESKYLVKSLLIFIYDNFIMLTKDSKLIWN